MSKRLDYRSTVLVVSLLLVAAVTSCGDSAPTGTTNPPPPPPPPSPPAQPTITITSPSGALRQGDVVSLTAEVRDTTGVLASDPNISWSIRPATAGVLTQDDRFVPNVAGPVDIIAVFSVEAVDTVTLNVAARNVGSSFTFVGSSGTAPPARLTTTMWAHGNNAYSGTLGAQVQGVPDPGRTLFVWDISDPTNITLTDSIKVDAPRLNDIKVSADGLIGVLTHEGSTDGLNGITILDLADPAHPVIISRFTAELEAGVHKVWIEGRVVFAAVDNGEFRIIDISDPLNPVITARINPGPATVLHNEVWIRDGIAFFSAYDNGLIIFDVGGGSVGGSLTNPVELGRVLTQGGQTHNAWYWPAAGYVFVGEEDFTSPGVVHVIDVSDLAAPREVANYRISTTTTHNFWMDETKGILYVGWYEAGAIALDVNGELIGSLHQQGRLIAQMQYAATGIPCSPGFQGQTCSWGIQLHNGKLFLSDFRTGIVVLDPPAFTAP